MSDLVIQNVGGKGRFSTCSVLTGARFPSLLQILYILHWQLSSASYEGLEQYSVLKLVVQPKLHTAEEGGRGPTLGSPSQKFEKGHSIATIEHTI